ncbi:MAG: hypothetical protein KIS95_04745 [Anaerolineae bacterium]|uniref:HAAS signaling domain-containing protein n=1 Tax=Promineifilum sp. TaxID=2664178 RepID=UPI001DA922FE|nr:hypothetical protein [Anaerolineales bacterium]MCB8935378.1 hypothetical protein [Promineifilum sp.]MCO5181992.1 hypothetical protein [Promineifilum sp.]MCW5846515.1 hypothetical protein [Anaerolineae bacterium]
MNDLVERYVHQVARYLPESERKEIQNELRSLIRDQLDDRYKASYTEDDVVELLTELGDPRRMAASYGGEQYLIGPELYPIMVHVLQRGWLWLPALVVIIRVLLAFLLAEPGTLIGLFLETVFTVVQAVFVFSGIVVIIFAILQHSGEKLEEIDGPFNPRHLPRVEDSAGIDRGEVALGIAFNIFTALVLTYFLRVGGLTLRFNLTEPIDVLPVPALWLAVGIASTVGLILVNGIVLRRGRWSAGLALADLALDMVGVVAGYYFFILPLVALLFEKVPGLMSLPFADNAPVILAVFLGFFTAVEGLGRLIKMILGRHGNDRAYASAQPEG